MPEPSTLRRLAIIVLAIVVCLGVAWAIAGLSRSPYERDVDTACARYRSAPNDARNGDGHQFGQDARAAHSMVEPMAEETDNTAEVSRWSRGATALELLGRDSPLPRDASNNDLDAVCSAHDGSFWGM